MLLLVLLIVFGTVTMVIIQTYILLYHSSIILMFIGKPHHCHHHNWHPVATECFQGSGNWGWISFELSGLSWSLSPWLLPYFFITQQKNKHDWLFSPSWFSPWRKIFHRCFYTRLVMLHLILTLMIMILLLILLMIMILITHIMLRCFCTKLIMLWQSTLSSHSSDGLSGKRSTLLYNNHHDYYQKHNYHHHHTNHQVSVPKQSTARDPMDALSVDFCLHSVCKCGKER